MKYNKLLFTIFLSCFLSIFMLTETRAQTINGNVFFYDQDAINAFDDGITTINGNLTINQYVGTRITDLSPLSSLVTVTGNINISENPGLVNLDGLNGITSVGGALWFKSNPALTSLAGLNNITTVGGDLVIQSNSGLKSLTGLDALTSVGGLFGLINNEALTNLDGLSRLTIVGGYIDVDRNYALTSLSSLNALTSVGGDLKIESSPALTNLSGLDALTSVGGILYIYNNTSLTEFCSLYPLLYGNGLVGAYSVSSNASNPTKQQIIDGGACVSATPEEMIAELITSVNESGIHKRTKRLLTGFLKSADKSLDRGRERIAILKLVAFKWIVKVQSRRKIDAALADEWIGKAEEIIDAIKAEAGLNKSSEFEELASEDLLPETYSLNQNYPNPFNPSTTISYSIPENGNVSLSIYDALGSEVAVLDNGYRAAGNYSHNFDASNLSSGMYFYTIRSGNFVQTKKMLLMK